MTIKVTPSFQGTCVAANHLNIPYNCAIFVMLKPVKNVKQDS